MPPSMQESRSFKVYSKQAFVDDLNNVPWNVIDTADSIDDAD